MFIYKLARTVTLPQLHSRISLSLFQLRLHHTVLFLDKDKEILTESQMVQLLEQMPDQNAILETP